MTPASTSAATRLCTACGMCCNGVMFHMVQMQPGDAPKELVALGMKLKRKKRQQYILQPCPALKGCHCSIYLQRPERCQLFECRLLKAVAREERSEAEAVEIIRDVRQRVEQVTGLLQRGGKSDERRPLSKRFDKIMTDLAAAPNEPELAALREELGDAMTGLNDLLNRDFRLVPLAL